MKVNCIFCGYEIDVNDLFCSECGQSQRDEQQQNDEDIFVCPTCGAENAPGLNHCAFCCSIFR